MSLLAYADDFASTGIVAIQPSINVHYPAYRDLAGELLPADKFSRSRKSVEVFRETMYVRSMIRIQRQIFTRLIALSRLSNHTTAHALLRFARACGNLAGFVEINVIDTKTHRDL